MTPDPIARNVVVSGRVQGVFFRDSARREARRAGITGWVTNRPDGKVEAHFEGDASAVAQLVEWCRSGPRHADVDEIEVSEVAPEGLDRFAVR
jgi:acylphosphatase